MTRTPTALVDIGLNLAHDSFDHDREQVVANARSAGVSRMVVTGSTLESSRAAIALVRTDSIAFRCTAGVHPHHASELREEDLPALRDLIASPEVAAAGE